MALDDLHPGAPGTTPRGKSLLDPRAMDNTHDAQRELRPNNRRSLDPRGLDNVNDGKKAAVRKKLHAMLMASGK